MVICFLLDSQNFILRFQIINQLLQNSFGKECKINKTENICLIKSLILYYFSCQKTIQYKIPIKYVRSGRSQFCCSEQRRNKQYSKGLHWIFPGFLSRIMLIDYSYMFFQILLVISNMFSCLRENVILSCTLKILFKKKSTRQLLPNLF